MILNNQNKDDQQYTFTPKIYSNNSFDELKIITPRYTNLYEKSKHRLELHKNRTIHFYKNIKNANKYDKNMKAMCKSKSSNNINQNYHEKLYDDHLIIRNKKLSLANEIYKEIPFKPKINESIKVCSNFFERNEKLILKKKVLYNDIKDYNNSNNKNKRSLSKEEREINNKKVVDRLYTKEMEKIEEKENIKNVLNIDNKQNKMFIQLKTKHNIKFNKVICAGESRENIQNININNQNLTINETIKNQQNIENEATKKEIKLDIEEIDKGFINLSSQNKIIENSIIENKMNDFLHSQNNFKSRALINLIKERKGE